MVAEVKYRVHVYVKMLPFYCWAYCCSERIVAVLLIQKNVSPKKHCNALYVT